jgi:hypothetical protein
VPTPTPVPTPTLAQLQAACGTGTPIPEAIPYAGSVHSYTVGKSGIQDGGVWAFADFDAPFQIIICEYDNADIQLPGYCWYSDNTGKQYQLGLVEGSETVRVLVARTGETLGTKTLSGLGTCPGVYTYTTEGSIPTLHQAVWAPYVNDWIRSFTNLDTP